MNHRSPLQRLLAALAFTLPLLASSCLIGSETHTRHEGRRVSDKTLQKVKAGNSTEYVLALLGEPSTRTPVEEGRQIWKWQYRTVKSSESSIFLIAAGDSKTEEAGAVFVEFQEDQVVRTWRD